MRLEIRDVEVPIPSDTQALIRVKAVGVCGTDVHMYHGEIGTPVPITIGHEFCGIVESTGSKVTKVKKNDSTRFKVKCRSLRNLYSLFKRKPTHV